MRTLVIHPKDESTDFLKIMYQEIKDKTVITGDVSKEKVLELISLHERIIICGHGTPNGLFSVGQFNAPYIVDLDAIEFLRMKQNSVLIWCNADEFVDRYGLSGFYSGMFISEVAEAYYCGLQNITQSMIDESNYCFCKAMSENLHLSHTEMYQNVKSIYSQLAQTNPVANYNCERLYLK